MAPRNPTAGGCVHVQVRRLVVIGLAAAGATLVALPAAGAPAKEGVVARLAAPVPRTAEAGMALRLAWTLTTRTRFGSTAAFSALGVFVQLENASGEAATAFAREKPLGKGRYSARVRVPVGGIATVRIGLRGTRCVGEECEPSDVFFRVVEPRRR